MKIPVPLAYGVNAPISIRSVSGLGSVRQSVASATTCSFPAHGILRFAHGKERSHHEQFPGIGKFPPQCRHMPAQIFCTEFFSNPIASARVGTEPANPWVE